MVKIKYSSPKVKLALSYPRTQIKKSIRVAFRRISDIVIDDIHKGFKSPKSGRLYGIHRASAPGEYPAIMTGGLYHSIDSTMHGSYTLEVGTNKSYAPFLEYGSSRILPRPFMESTMKRTIGKVRQSFYGSLRSYL